MLDGVRAALPCARVPNLSNPPGISGDNALAVAAKRCAQHSPRMFQRPAQWFTRARIRNLSGVIFTGCDQPQSIRTEGRPVDFASSGDQYDLRASLQNFF